MIFTQCIFQGYLSQVYVPVSSSLNYNGSVLAVLFQATVELLA